jgi:hypothetical protein
MSWMQGVTRETTSADKLFSEVHNLMQTIDKHLDEEPNCTHDIRLILSEAFGE